MARLQAGHWLCFWLLWVVPGARTAEAQRTPKELIQYVEDAKKLGLKDDVIRQNAIAGGWNKEMVGEALAIVRYLSDTSERTPERTPTTPPTTGGGQRPEVPRKSVVEPEGYRIGAGDVLQIAVWKEPEASVPSVVVRADGKISVPFIKEIEVAGMTPAETEKVLAEKLGKFIRVVDVTVIPKEINSLKIFLVGAVKKEGPIPMHSSLTVLQALNEGGGLTDFAKRKKIYILRNDGGKKIRLPVDYEAVIKGEKPEQNVLLRPDDTIVVP